MAQAHVAGSFRFGVKWTAIGIASTRLSRFGSNVVLARLLAIEVFGLLAMANAVIVLVEALRQAGLGQAYIQREPREDEAETEAVDTMFMGSLALNAVLFLSLNLLAPHVASFFEDDRDRLLSVLRALSLMFVLDGFVSTPNYVLQRRMAFDRIARAELAGALCSAGVAITLALCGLGVWALVCGQLSGHALFGAILAKSAGWRPGFRGSRRVARELLGYGKFLWGFSLVRAGGRIVDRMVVGKARGAAGLGGYTQAFNLCNLPSALIAQLVNRVALPAMSRMRQDPPALQAAFLGALGYAAFFSVPIGVGLFAVSEDLVPVLYGARWAGIVPIVDILAFYGAALAVSSCSGPVFQALGKPKIMFHAELLRQGVLLLAFLFLARYGETGVAWSVLIALMVVNVVTLAIVARLLSLRLLAVGSPILRSMASSLVMLVAVSLARGVVPQEWGAVASLVAGVVTGVAVYPLISLICNPVMMKDLLQTLRGILDRRGAKGLKEV